MAKKAKRSPFVRISNDMAMFKAALGQIDAVLKNLPFFERLVRDQFAMYAVAAAGWAETPKLTAKQIARKAYDIADAMMKERKIRNIQNIL